MVEDVQDAVAFVDNEVLNFLYKREGLYKILIRLEIAWQGDIDNRNSGFTATSKK